MHRILASLLLATLLLAGCDSIRAAMLPRPDPNGPYVLIEIDAQYLRLQRLAAIADEMGQRLRQESPAIRYTGRGVIEDAARIRAVDLTELPRARAALATLPSSVVLSEQADGVIEARLTEAGAQTLLSEAMQRAADVLQRRLDPAEIDGTSIERYSDDQLIIRTRYPERVRALTGAIGALTLHVVREADSDDVAARRAPPGTKWVEPYPGIGDRAELVERRPRLTGDSIMDARPIADRQTGMIALSFRLDPEGTRTFCSISRRYVGQRFAILLDDRVLTAPTINEPICGGQGQIMGNFTRETVNDLALTLRAGALPAPFTVIREGVGQVAD